MTDKYNSRIAAILGKMNGNPLWAITISSTCTLYSCPEDQVDAKWKKHEDEHKRRIKEMGWLNFMATYLWRNLTVGYDHSEFEAEAEAAALK